MPWIHTRTSVSPWQYRNLSFPPARPFLLDNVGAMDNLPSSATALIGSAVAVCLLLANAKSLPLAHTLRLLPSLYRLFHPRLFPATTPPTKTTRGTTATTIGGGGEEGGGGSAAAAHPTLFTHHTSRSRAVVLDLDVNLHKSNSTFFSDADVSRAALLSTLLSAGLARTAAMPLLAAVQCAFKREIAPFRAYDVSSRVLAWDEKSVFVVTYFVRPGFKLRGATEVEVGGGPGAVLRDGSLRKGVFAVMVSRYVCKAGRETVPPRKVLEAAGLLVPQGGKEGEAAADGLLAAEFVDEAVKSGLQYVSECMMV